MSPGIITQPTRDLIAKEAAALVDGLKIGRLIHDGRGTEQIIVKRMVFLPGGHMATIAITVEKERKP